MDALTPANLKPNPLPDVFRVDNVFPEAVREKLHAYLRADAGWQFGWKSSRKNDEFSFWHKHFAGYRNARDEKPYDCNEELARNAPLIHQIWRQLEQRIFAGHTLVRCYANGQNYGTDGTIHKDSRSPNSYTAVYYPHRAWTPNWAGETVLFTPDRDDIAGVCYPKPNRLFVFKGNIPHAARGVSRTCPELRITLMWKTLTDLTDD